MKIKHTLGIALAIAIASVAWYGLSPLIFTETLNEPIPVTSSKSEDVTTSDSNSEEAAQDSSGATIVGTFGHPASGTVRIVSDGVADYVRYENLQTINGPDLYVYLATDLEAKDFISLGRVKATEGNINYSIPNGVDINKYKYVLIWCKAFGVLFNSANLDEAQ